MLVVSILPHSTIFLLEFGSIPTVWYFVFLILLTTSLFKETIQKCTKVQEAGSHKINLGKPKFQKLLFFKFHGQAKRGLKMPKGYKGVQSEHVNQRINHASTLLIFGIYTCNWK